MPRTLRSHFAAPNGRVFFVCVLWVPQVGLDHTKTTGEKFGMEWLATLTNEMGQLLSVLAVDSTKATELLAWCTAIADRTSFEAKGKSGTVLSIDNVPTNFVGTTEECRYRGLVYVGADELHAVLLDVLMHYNYITC